MFNRNPFYPPVNNMFGFAPKPKFNWGSILNNTQKTLGIINQAIPIFYQIKPIWNNAKTMFRVMGEMSKINNNNRSNTRTTNSSTPTVNNQTTTQSIFQNNQPNFFI